MWVCVDVCACVSCVCARLCVRAIERVCLLVQVHTLCSSPGVSDQRSLCAHQRAAALVASVVSTYTRGYCIDGTCAVTLR